MKRRLMYRLAMVGIVLLLCAFVAHVGAGEANAGDKAPTVISTGPAYKPLGYSAGYTVQNVGTSSVTVYMELLNLQGEVLDYSTFEFDPGTGNGVGQPIGYPGGWLWARFTMVSGSSANIRANLGFYQESNGHPLIILEAR